MTGSSKRIDTQMVIWFQKASDPETKAVASNLSETGLFIATDEPAKVGDRLALRLALSRDSGPLEMQGEIKWTRAQGQQGEEVLPAGWGIEFIGGQELGIIRERVRQRIKEIQAQIAVMLADGRRNNQAQLSTDERDMLHELISNSTTSDSDDDI